MSVIDSVLHVAITPNPRDNNTLSACVAVIHALFEGSDTRGSTDIGAPVIDATLNSKGATICSNVQLIVVCISKARNRLGDFRNADSIGNRGHDSTGGGDGTSSKELSCPY